jgi:hypothetical protein
VLPLYNIGNSIEKQPGENCGHRRHQEEQRDQQPMLATAAITSSSHGHGSVSKADDPTQMAASKPANNSSVSPIAFHRTDLKAGDRTSFAARKAEEIIGVVPVPEILKGGRRR